MEYFTYEDYVKSTVEWECWTLNHGVKYAMPRTRSALHQLTLQAVLSTLHKQIAQSEYDLFLGPQDVLLFANLNTPADKIDVVVQPDLFIMENGCWGDYMGQAITGVPSFVVEILWHDSIEMDCSVKYALYESAGVPEYWIVDPVKKHLSVYTLMDGIYTEARQFATSEKVPLMICGGDIDLADIWLK